MRPTNPRADYRGGRPVTYHGPVGSDVLPLPALVTETGEVVTEWELDFDERGAILDGARIVLTFQGAMPPCRIEVEGVEGA